MIKHIEILGVRVHITNMRAAVLTIEEWLTQGEKNYVCVRDVHGVMACRRDRELMRIHNTGGLTVPDGMPLVWAGRFCGFAEMGRVYGPDLMLSVCEESVPKGYAHFLYGGKPDAAEELRNNLEEWFPGIRIVGTYTPPFRPLTSGEGKELVALTARLKPDIFWVGLGTPKQEKFMAAYLPRLETRVMLGVGAAFDIHTGRAKDAPDFVKKAGMQWFYRLLQEPGRLWKRYLINVPLFICLLGYQLISGRMKKSD